MDHQKLKKMSAQDIQDLIQDVLHNKDFDPNNVDNNMHQRLMCAVQDWKMDILNMWQEGDGEQDTRFFNCKVEIVLLELLADEQLEDCQYFSFKEYKHAH